MDGKQIKEYQEAITVVQRLADRMAKYDEFSGRWADHAGLVLDDMREYVDSQYNEEVH